MFLPTRERVSEIAEQGKVDCGNGFSASSSSSETVERIDTSFTERSFRILASSVCKKAEAG
jgi:hypothetical protein